MASALPAGASSGLDSPDSGVEQAGRGSAWLARANDPTAVYFNPAAMAFQATSVHLGSQILFSRKCFTRTTSIDPSTGKSIGAPVAVPAGPGIDSGATPLLPGQKGPMAPETAPSDVLCSNSGASPVPQLGAVFRVHDRVAVGIALITPHSAGNASWPTSLNYTNRFTIASSQPSPQRYMLTNSNALIINPTVAVAYAPLDTLSFGVGFIWGIATADFSNFAESASQKPAAGDVGDHFAGDVQAELKAKDLFIPGVVLSALWSANSMVDLAAWFKWQDAIKGTANLTLDAQYWKASGVPNTTYCSDNSLPKGCNITSLPNAGTFQLNVPMEAKLGFRFHLPRADQSKKPGWASAPTRRVRDPLSEDWFDVEADFTWANNSAVQDIQLNFNPGQVIKTTGGTIPTNGNIPHNWRDVFGVRLGADVVAVPNLLTLRAGGFYESKGQDDRYLQLDFDLASKVGISGGATVRAGPVDISLMYGHTFYGTLDNGGNGGIYALSGDSSGLNTVCKANGVTTNKAGQLVAPSNYSDLGPGCYRSYQAVNGGNLTSFMNEFGLSATARF
jgi:long-chain fatty acid transport protein